jgi:hypothetical protein
MIRLILKEDRVKPYRFPFRLYFFLDTKKTKVLKPIRFMNRLILKEDRGKPYRFSDIHYFFMMQRKQKNHSVGRSDF